MCTGMLTVQIIGHSGAGFRSSNEIYSRLPCVIDADFNAPLHPSKSPFRQIFFEVHLFAKKANTPAIRFFFFRSAAEVGIGGFPFCRFSIFPERFRR